MKASELIERVRKQIVEHGDLEVRVLNDDHDSFDPVFSVEHATIMGLPNCDRPEAIVVNYE